MQVLDLPNSDRGPYYRNSQKLEGHISSAHSAKFLSLCSILSPICLGLSLFLSGCASSDPSTHPGMVSATVNPQVALYTIVPPRGALVTIQFGTDTKYGMQTWTRSADVAGDAVNIEVAGMLAHTTYHMRARMDLPNGTVMYDADHTFTTGRYPGSHLPGVSVTTTAGMTPQPGIEMVDIVSENVPIVATDLAGNVIWWYQFQGTSVDTIQPIKLLPNGDFIVVITPGSEALITPPAPPAGTIDVVREIDLAGNMMREISIDTLNSELAAAGINLTLGAFHHDVAPLPNGHWIVIANTVKLFRDLPGYPGVTNVLGDVLVDLDTNLKPVWVWNEFDYLDVNRHPFAFPDWTHTNAVVYSPDDGNLLVSIRDQNLIVKVDYRDGAGSGDILWRLGYQGDFKLQGGNDPTDWFYAQHAPAFLSPNTTGNFSMGLFDNGDDREYPPGLSCQPTAASTCPYSTATILDIDEAAKTATLAFHYVTPQYSGFGGNVELLQNGNVEFDQNDGGGLQDPDADVYEVTPGSSIQTVWHMHVGQYAYRAFRMPSLYPGVQW